MPVENPPIQRFGITVEEASDANGFVARVIAVPEVTGQGDTEAAAIADATQRLRAWVATHRVVVVEVPLVQGNPWMELAGLLADDPLFDDYKADVENRRRDANAAQ